MVFQINKFFSVCALLALGTLLILPQYNSTMVPRVFAQGQQPDDARLKPLKDYDGYFPFRVSKSPQAWAKRAEHVRNRIKVATGLWPMPVASAIKATIHGKIDQGDYSVEKVYFESSPGLYVTGNLYRPKGKKGPHPAVLCPHGHWPDGRFHKANNRTIKRQLADGAEKFADSGRYPLQSRCVQLARMGCIVFHYDMIGYADNTPITRQVAHRFAKQTAQRNQANQWGLFSAEAELRLQSALGLQTLSSKRALDWIASLPEVDTKRIAITGSSGGGTQTFILSAIDPRLVVSFPAVMVSTAMQGGCSCENATYLRIGTGNVEFAAMFAPKPLGMSFANDWTKEMPKLGMPYLKQHFKMLGKPENVVGQYFSYPHNYNQTSRALMYKWFNQHLKLGMKDTAERDFKPLSQAQLTVWNKNHPKPEANFKAEAALLKNISEASTKQIAVLSTNGKQYRNVMKVALEVMIGRELPTADDVVHEDINNKEMRDHQEIRSIVRNTKYKEELPTIFLYPKKWNKQAVLWISPKGKAGLYDEKEALLPEVQSLIDNGTCVVGVDLFGLGEFLKDGKPIEQTRCVKDSREFAGFTFGFNHPLFVKRVHDVMTMVSFLKYHKLKPEKIHLVGTKGAAHWVAAAATQTGKLVDRVAVDTAGFRFGKVNDIRKPDFWPGAVKYGDLPMLLAMSAPTQLWIAGEGKKLPPLVSSVYAKDSTKKAAAYQGEKKQSSTAMVKWLNK